LELRDVAVAYDGRTVLDVPRLAVRRGEILTLLGENGSGKTTLLRLLGLLLRPARGSICFDGERVEFGNRRRLLELRRHTASVMQEPLLCRMSVRRNVALGLRFRHLTRPEIERRVRDWLERLSIPHLGDRPAAKLSGGEAQRTSLARAMVLEPQVLFLDEPFAALDAPTRQNLLQEFRTVLAGSSVTAVYATHDRAEALGLGDRVAVLREGHVAQVGTTEEVFSRPEQVEVARFVGVETLIPGRVTREANGLVQVDCGEIQLAAAGQCEPGQEVCIAVRPEEIDLHDGSSPLADEPGNVLAGRVIRATRAETHHRVEIDCGVRIVAAINRARFRELKLEAGRQVQAIFPARAAHLIRKSRPKP
jgi:tungstate transport system ATP-binding protein